MKCLILAAGYATRLYPLTENFPKPLLKVGDKTILDWLVDDIDTTGLVDTYVVISNHKFAHHFEDWAATKKQNIRVVDDGTSSNETRLGAVCDVQFAIDQLGLDDDMLVIAGDNVLDFSLSKFVAYAKVVLDIGDTLTGKIGNVIKGDDDRQLFLNAHGFSITVLHDFQFSINWVDHNNCASQTYVLSGTFCGLHKVPHYDLHTFFDLQELVGESVLLLIGKFDFLHQQLAGSLAGNFIIEATQRSKRAEYLCPV